jgi:hypothetical protein
MRVRSRTLVLVPLLLTAAHGCRGNPALPMDLGERLAAAPAGTSARLWLRQDRIVSASVPTGGRGLPLPVRTAIEAVLPDGETTFVGEEWGPFGEGFRIDKRYGEPEPHERTALIARDGRVLQRAHTVPLRKVPEHVLAAAIVVAPLAAAAWIVSGPEHEEHWTIVVRTRSGEEHAVDVSLDGRRHRSRRRLDGRIEG